MTNIIKPNIGIYSILYFFIIKSKNIQLIAAPEGNKNAVGEHTLGLLLSLMNKLRNGHQSIRQGDWLREEHRGWELEGKTIGIIGYGNTGKKFAEKLKGFNVTIIYNDILRGIGDKNATEVSIKTLQEKSDVLSLHIPQNESTNQMINTSFIKAMKKASRVMIVARTEKGKQTIDHYSLMGFSKAYDAAIKNCS